MNNKTLTINDQWTEMDSSSEYENALVELESTLLNCDNILKFYDIRENDEIIGFAILFKNDQKTFFTVEKNKELTFIFEDKKLIKIKEETISTEDLLDIAHKALDTLLTQPEYGMSFIKEFIPTGITVSDKKLQEIDQLICTASQNLQPYVSEAIKQAFNARTV